jgi:chemotaxis protein histidine kinase CheA
MMNIIPRGPSIGELLGQGLSDIATHFADRYSSTKALKGLGFSDAQAKAYAHLGPQIQQQAVQAKLQEQQQQASNAAINQILGAGLGQTQPYQPQTQFQAQPQVQQQPQSMAQQIQLPHERQQAAIQQATSIAQNPAFRKLQEQQQSAQALQQQQLMKQLAPQAQRQPTGEQQAILQAQAQQAQRAEPTLKQQIEQVRNQKRALAAANLPVNQAIALHQQLENKEKELRREAREERKEALEERKLSAVEQRYVDKETLPVYKEINDKAKASKDSNIRLGRMEHLINRGQLSNTAFYNGVKALGKIPGIGGYIESIAESFLSPDTQEFEKLSTDFIKDAKQFFGNRITQQEVAMFLKTVPNLSQTNAGKHRVIRNMRIFNEAAGLRKKIMDEIIRDNNGKRPADLESLIEERAEPQLNALAEQFKGNIA